MDRRKDLIAAAERSLDRLGTEYIDLYQLHWPNYTVPIDETMSAMEELAEAGKIRFIGVRNFSIGELERAQSGLARHRIVANQMRYSLIEGTIESGMLKYCQENSMTIIAFSPPCVRGPFEITHGRMDPKARGLNHGGQDFVSLTNWTAFV